MSAAAGFSLPSPALYEIHDPNVAEKWKTNPTGVRELRTCNRVKYEGEPIQVATLLTVIGEEAKEVSSTFNDWVAHGDDRKSGAPATIFCKITVRRSKYCLEISKA